MIRKFRLSLELFLSKFANRVGGYPFYKDLSASVMMLKDIPKAANKAKSRYEYV